MMISTCNVWWNYSIKCPLNYPIESSGGTWYRKAARLCLDILILLLLSNITCTVNRKSLWSVFYFLYEYFNFGLNWSSYRGNPIYVSVGRGYFGVMLKVYVCHTDFIQLTDGCIMYYCHLRCCRARVAALRKFLCNGKMFF